jgi:hypothetical protein
MVSYLQENILNNWQTEVFQQQQSSILLHSSNIAVVFSGTMKESASCTCRTCFCGRESTRKRTCR